jgi:hypothetical protein
MLDVFNNNAFNLISLTTAINKMPYQPGRLGDLGLFRKSGITSLTVVVEEQQGKLAIVPTAARNSSPNVFSGPRRKTRAFQLVHLPLAANVQADDVQGVRAFGSETELQTVAGLVNDKLAMMRQWFETTHEYYRIGAIQGVMLDADGSTVIYNWYNEFGLSEPSVSIDWTQANSVKRAAGTVRRAIEDALGMDTYTGIVAMCGKTAYSNLIVKDEVKTSFNTYGSSSMGQFLREDQSRGRFTFAGIDWEEYRGAIGATPFIGDTVIRFFPVGAANVFLEVYGPATFAETVNTRGIPVYAKQERQRFDVGIDIFGQSNPLVLCTRPAVLIKGTTTGTPPT